MDTTELQRLLRAEADAERFPTADATQIISAARRHRRRRRGLASAVTAIAVAGVAVGLIATNSSAGGPATLVPASPTTSAPPSPPATPSSPRPSATFAPVAPPAWTPLSAAPGTVLGLVGAGAERIAVLSAGDGHVLRYAPGAGSQALLFRYGPMLLQPTDGPVECRYEYKQVNPSTGAVVAPPAGLPPMAELAAGSSGQRIAYGLHEPAGRHQEVRNGRHITVRGGCGASPVDLYVSDPVDGTVRRWTGNNSNALYASLDAHGTHVAFLLDGHVRVLDINGPEQTLQQAPILPTPSDCTVTSLMYQPGSDAVLWVAQTCPSGTYLTRYNPLTRRQGTQIQVAPAGSQRNIGSFDVAPTGRIIGTLSAFSSAPDDGRVFTIDGATVDPFPATGVYQVLW